jgi:hypothetical protein
MSLHGGFPATQPECSVTIDNSDFASTVSSPFRTFQRLWSTLRIAASRF